MEHAAEMVHVLLHVRMLMLLCCAELLQASEAALTTRARQLPSTKSWMGRRCEGRTSPSGEPLQQQQQQQPVQAQQLPVFASGVVSSRIQAQCFSLYNYLFFRS
jgi:flagellar biosynthesis/type III secretory pathway ATPase